MVVDLRRGTLRCLEEHSIFFVGVVHGFDLGDVARLGSLSGLGCAR
jgi:hypothetical protein